MEPIKLPFYARLAYILLSLVLILLLLYLGRSIFIPLFFAVLISVVLFPVSNFIEKKLRLGRLLAAIISVMIFVCAISAIIYFLSLQIARFSKDIPSLITKLTNGMYEAQDWIAQNYYIDDAKQMEYINNAASDFLKTGASSLGNVVISLTGLVIFNIFVIIYTFFMLYHRRLLSRFILSLFHPQYHSEVSSGVEETRSVINSYIIGLLTEMAVVAVIVTSVFSLLGLPYAFFIGVLAAVLNIIPYIGIYIASAISMLIVFASTGNTHDMLEAFLVLVATHTLDSNILMPRIVGGKVKMNPFITIVAVIVGHQIWGIAGMFLFIPLTGIVKIITEHVPSLKPWSILIGEDVHEEPGPKK